MFEHHFRKIDDVGIAWSENRIWVCFNGQAVFRAKVWPDGKLQIEFHKEDAESAQTTDA